MALTSAQILLDAIQAAIESDVPLLQDLSQKYALKPELVLRIVLTFLPESTAPSIYIPILQDIAGGLPELHYGSDTDSTERKERPSGQTSPEEARRRVKTVRLLSLDVEDHIERGVGDSLSDHLVSFLLIRARKIDIETGSLPLVQQLMNPFIEQSAFLKLWMGTTILPLLRLNYEIYSERDEPIPLEMFEELRGGGALDILVGGGLGKTSSLSVEEYVRDLKQIVGPWILGEIYRRRARRKFISTNGITKGASNTQEEDAAVSTWGWLDNWLLHLADQRPSIALSIVNSEDWKGSGDVDDGGWISDSAAINQWLWNASITSEAASFKQMRDNHARTCMCLFYTAQGASEEVFSDLEQLLVRNAEYRGYEGVVVEIVQRDALQPTPPESFFHSIKPVAHRMKAMDLLSDQNPLTNLSIDSFVLAAWFLKTSKKLLNLDAPLPISKVIEIAFLGTANEQRGLLQRYLQLITDKKIEDSECKQIHGNIQLLQRRPCSNDGEATLSYGIWGQLDTSEIAAAFLKSLVANGRYKLATDMYFSGEQSLPEEVVEDTILTVALATFDAATNGNRTRGSMKKASDIAAAFSAKFPASAKFPRFAALLRATHSLSFYSLTLQHGVTCTPVNIRTQSQPLTLIDRVLTQNRDAYTSLDDLTRIAVDLVQSGLLLTLSGQLVGSHSLSHSSTSSSSIPSFLSLSAADSDATAKAATQAVASKSIRAALDAGDFDTAYSYITTRLSGKSSPDTWEAVDDENTLWRTALAAGRFELRSSERSGPKYLRRLEQKMELLASALELAPPPALTEVLEAWQECEAQVNAATTKEAEADTAWNDSGDKRASLRLYGDDRHLPGGFGAEAWIPNAEGTGGRKWTGGDEEAPMGLFDVARGAAAALQKSAFAGKAGARGGSKAFQGLSKEQHGGADELDSHEKVRKRDVVSNAVTSGLASGIGWVIGATPNREQ